MSNLYVYLQHGWRNLWLYPMRTGLTLVALTFGIAALTFLSAMNDGWLQQMRTNFTMLLMGHVQVHALGFETGRNLSDHIESPDRITSQLDSESLVAGWTRRIRVSGLASTAAANAGVRVFAIEPEREKNLSNMARFVQQGRWLTSDDDRAILVGQGLADRLQVKPGSKVVLMVVLANGDVASEVFRVRGIIFSGVMDIDNFAAIIPLSSGQRWLGLENAVTDIVLFTHDIEAVPRLVSGLRERYSDHDLEVLSWSDIDSMAKEASQFADITKWIVMSIVIFVVMVEVLNTMLMSMHERTREFGMMGALGVTHYQIFAMILWETLILVLTGSVIGFVLGAWISAYFGEQGIDLSQYQEAFAFTYLESVVHPKLFAESVINILGATVIGAFLAGLYPAWRAAKLNPAVAMRKI